MSRIREKEVDWSNIYQNAPAPIWEQSPHEYSKLAVELTEPGQALDLGCGEGYDALYFAEQGYDTIALDISPSALDTIDQAAQKKGLRIETVESTVTAFEITKKQAIIASFGVLHFLGGDYIERLAHFKDKTADGGVHAIYVFGNDGDFHAIAQHKFWFPDINNLRSLYQDWKIHRLETKTTEMLIKGDKGEILHNQLIKLLAQKKQHYANF